uniref:Uncharacterized protein n=1 Tax=Anguilla anguilla TaxID=7936 RepID=A0A0E9PHS3_ANGAN
MHILQFDLKQEKHQDSYSKTSLIIKSIYYCKLPSSINVQTVIRAFLTLDFRRGELESIFSKSTKGNSS